MNNTIYDIILVDGTTIRATLNGNNYITEQTVDETILSNDNLNHITIKTYGDGDDSSNVVAEDIYDDMICTNIWQQEEGYTRFIIRGKTKTEKLAEERTQVETNIQMALAEIYEMVIGG